VFEVAYTQPTRSVVLEAARHICLTRGQVQLVVAIDIVHKANTKPRELESVTWSHWEEDVLSYREVEDEAEGMVDDIRPEAPDREDDEGEDDEEGKDDEEEAGEAEDSEGGNNSEVDDEVENDDYLLPSPTAYTAVVTQPGDQKRYRMRLNRQPSGRYETTTIPSSI